MTFYPVPIVEGETEVECFERLLHLVWERILNAADRLQVAEPFRGKRGSLIDPTHPSFLQKIEEASRTLARLLRRDPSGRGLVLLLLDAERDCVRQLVATLLPALRPIRPDLPIACVLAKQMFENWIVAGASTLAGVNGLPNPLPRRHDFEGHNGAAWLDEQMRSQRPPRKYRKTIDAIVFVRAMDLRECRENSPSFNKLCRVLEGQLPPPDEPPTEEVTPQPQEEQTDA